MFGIARPWLIAGAVVAVIAAAGGIYAAGYAAGDRSADLDAARDTIATLEARNRTIVAALETAKAGLAEAEQAEAENRKRVDQLAAELAKLEKLEPGACPPSPLITPKDAEALNAIR